MALLYVSIVAAGCWVLCRSFLHITQDAKEPPMIPHAIPYIGPLVGLLRHGFKFFGIPRSVSENWERTLFEYLAHK